jgi:hypothetical protein
MSGYSRLKNAVNPRRLDEELAEEMRDHCERRTAALQAKGLNAGEARRQADARFGNITRLREESRGIRLWAALEGTLQDLRYAWRGMRKGPAFATTSVLSLALAIGANTAIYSIVDAAILKPCRSPSRTSCFGFPGRARRIPEAQQPRSGSRLAIRGICSLPPQRTPPLA